MNVTHHGVTYYCWDRLDLMQLWVKLTKRAA
jgi:hypothetical protein